MNDEPTPFDDARADEHGDARADAQADARVDDALRDAGSRIRSEARGIDGRDIALAQARRSAGRSRRTSYVSVGVAAALIAAAVGFTVADRDDLHAEIAAGDDLAVGSPGQIVDALPAEPVDPHDVKLVADVKRFDSCAALRDELRATGAAHVGSLGFGSSGGYIAEMQTSASDLAFSPGPLALSDGPTGNTAGGGTGETLGTNVIVEGVDEPDSVKASGSLVVDLTGHQMRVIDTSTASIVSKVDLDTQIDPDTGSYAAPQSLLIEGDRALVLGTELVQADPIAGDPSASRPSIQYATLTFVDLSDPSAPTITDRVRIEGHLVAARMVEGQVRMVTSSDLADVAFVVPTTPNAVRPALEQNRLAVASSEVDDWLPSWDRGEGSEPERLVGCDQLVVPETFAGVQVTSLVSFAISGEFQPRSTAILAPADDITATATDVVVSSHIWVDPAEADDDYDDWSSALHRFSFDGDAPRYVASGAVPGSIRDDFSLAVLDESTVGAVTTDTLPWKDRAKAAVTVRTLVTDGEELVPTGDLDIATGTDSAGMRFIGQRLVISTGLAGNHISVVNLADPSTPALQGEVDLEGAGGYFHSVDTDRILVLGQGWRSVPQGGSAPRDLAVNLLDISGAPRVVDSFRLDDTTSPVTWDHHAFTWWPSESSAAFGVEHQSYDFGKLPPPPGAAFVEVLGDGLAQRLVTATEADLGPRCDPAVTELTDCDPTGQPVVQRVLVVDGEVWLYTSESLEKIDFASGASLAMVALRPAIF